MEITVRKAAQTMAAAMVLRAVTAQRAAQTMAAQAWAATSDIPDHLPAAHRGSPGRAVMATIQKWVLPDMVHKAAPEWEAMVLLRVVMARSAVLPTAAV